MARRTWLGFVVLVLAAPGLWGQPSAPASPPGHATDSLLRSKLARTADDNLGDQPSAIEYLDLSQGDDNTGGRTTAFYHGVWLAFMASVCIGMLWNAHQQNKHVKKLRQQAETVRVGSERARNEFLRRENLHFENTPLIVVELDAQRRIKQWTGRAEAVFGMRAMEALGKTIEELGWVDPAGVPALRAAFAPATGEEKAGRIVTVRHLTQAGVPRAIEWHVSVLPAAETVPESVLALGLDVSEQQRGAARLRETEQRYAMVAEAGAAAAWACVPESGVLNVDQTLAKLLGYDVREFPSRLAPWLQMFPSEDRARFEEALAAAAREPGVRQVVEARLRHRNGTYRWLRLTCFAEPGQGIIGTAADLTRIKLAEEKFRGLVEQSLAGIFIVQENRVVYANPKFWSIVRAGGARPSLRPEFLELVHFEDRAMTAERLRPVYAGAAQEAALLFRVAGPQGAAVAVQGHVIVSEHEGEPALLGLVTDVSHRFAQEQATRRMSQVVEQSPVAILISDPQGVIEYANRKFCEISSYAQEELLGQQPAILRPDSTPAEFYTELWTRLGQGKKWEGEHPVRAKDGRKFTARSVLFPIFDEGGAVTHCVMIMEDITSQRTLEERLARAQRLESIGNLAGGIAHDLNNILAPVRLGAEFLKTLPFAGKEREIIEVMDISIHRATELVQQVLAFSRGRRSKREALWLAPLVGELERLVRESFPRDVRLELRLARDLAPIKADPTQILQVLMNLCVNSRDAMPAGGVITLAADNVSLGAAQTGSFPGARPHPHVRLRVSDSGTGIPAQVRDKIFEPFFTTKDVGKGTGLGLSTALGIVQEHNGIIELESTGPHGTTFVIYLPASTEQPQPAGQEKAVVAKKLDNGDASARPGEGHTVLVVDDEVPLRQAVSFILGQRGYVVLEASDGVQAIELVKQHREIEVALLDVMMPRLDGVATMKALREIRPELRVIATSGVNHDTRVEAMRRMGVEHFLLKPYRNQELLEALYSCIDGNSKA